MLVIRDAQLQAFIAKDEKDVVKVVCEAVIKANPGRVKDIRPRRLISMVKIGIERAQAAGVTRTEDIAAFVALMFEVSPKFYRHPQVAAVLADQNFPIGERIQQLPVRVSDEAWEEISQVYDPKFWFVEAE
jgi:hypothetical protein